MKTKEEILSLLRSLQGIVNLDRLKEITDYIESFTPYKIDEERMKEVYETSNIYIISYNNSKTEMLVEQYNSTLPENKINPLPSVAPEWFLPNNTDASRTFFWNKLHEQYGTFQSDLQPLPTIQDLSDEIYDLNWHKLTPQDCEKLAEYLVRKYGTPKREELPSVEELRKEIVSIYQKGNASKGFLHHIAQHLVNKYKLPTQNREWWMDCEKFEVYGEIHNRRGYCITADNRILVLSKFDRYPLEDCTPYVEPVMTADDVIKAHNLSDAEVKAIREGGDMK